MSRHKIFVDGAKVALLRSGRAQKELQIEGAKLRNIQKLEKGGWVTLKSALAFVNAVGATLREIEGKPPESENTAVSAAYRAHESLKTETNHGKRPEPPLSMRDVLDLPAAISLNDLPQTTHEVFGREREQLLLERAWETNELRIVVIWGWGGGIGKSALVSHWLREMERDAYRGAARIFGWSFHNQGVEERETAGDDFINKALLWFGDHDATFGSPWDRGRRLAEFVSRERNLVILDGLEPLQLLSGPDRGNCSDPAVASFLRHLASQDRSLCVITTREAISNLKDLPTCHHENLENLSVEAAHALLKARGLRGQGAVFNTVIAEYGQHALALNLLASYLRAHGRSRIENAASIPIQGVAEAHHPGVHRILGAFRHRFEGNPELDLLRILALFDRPAEVPALRAVAALPRIQGLNSAALHTRLGDALDNLSRLGLVTLRKANTFNVVNIHPYVRRYFESDFKRHSIDGWIQTAARLFEYFRAKAPELPNDLEGISILHLAVRYGCEARLHNQSLTEVYWSRILRENQYYVTRILGAYSADLAALSHFFEGDWTKPATSLNNAHTAFVLFQAGLRLRAIGRLPEALQLFEAALSYRQQDRDWKNAAGVAGNISGLKLVLGDLHGALLAAGQSVSFADRSTDKGQQIRRRATRAAALLNLGKIQEAMKVFEETRAEAHWARKHSAYFFIYLCCLLELERFEEVSSLSTKEDGEVSLLAQALRQLCLARACAAKGDTERGLFAVEQALTGFRGAGRFDHVPLALMDRAVLYRKMGKFRDAQQDLGEALRISKEMGLILYQADCHAAFAELHLTHGDLKRAYASYVIASGMCLQMHYGRMNPVLKRIWSAIDAARIKGQHER